jgi:eukaryotic-like serine/threonine-protein kinase
VAKLGDFGLSRLQNDLLQTAEGYLLGTPHYISPEQANGDKAIDIRSDLYALGATFYHLLSMQPMFPGDNVQQVVLAHLTRNAPALGECAAGVSAGMCEIIDRLVQRDKSERYQTATALTEALSRLGPLADQPSAN